MNIIMALKIHTCELRHLLREDFYFKIETGFKL